MERSIRLPNRAESPAELSNRLLALQKELTLRVTSLATSLVQGTHPSVVAGRGMEADGVREYRPGDEPNRIDWRVTARKGRIHVREFSAERDLPTAIVLIRNPALNAGRGGIKATRALEASALLAAVAVARGDRVGLMVSPATAGSLRPLRSGRLQLELIIRRLLEEDWSESDSSPGETLARVGAFLKQPCQVYLVSDFQFEDETLHHLERGLLALTGRHSVTPVYVTDFREGHVPGGAACRWVDPHSGRIRRGGAERWDRDLITELDEHRSRVARTFRSLGLEPLSVDVGHDLLSRFHAFFSRSGQERRSLPSTSNHGMGRG